MGLVEPLDVALYKGSLEEIHLTTGPQKGAPKKKRYLKQDNCSNVNYLA